MLSDRPGSIAATAEALRNIEQKWLRRQKMATGHAVDTVHTYTTMYVCMRVFVLYIYTYIYADMCSWHVMHE